MRKYNIIFLDISYIYNMYMKKKKDNGLFKCYINCNKTDDNNICREIQYRPYNMTIRFSFFLFCNRFFLRVL